jgi:PadR family transcriptional regulator, regulatory protein PadR
METAPTTEALLLEVLAAGPLHGYAAISAIRDRSGGVLDFPEGTVYPVLHRLEREGRVSSTTQSIQGRARRVYELTPDGRTARMAHRHAWRAYAAAIDGLLGSQRKGAIA